MQIKELDLSCENKGYPFAETLKAKLDEWEESKCGILLHETFDAPDDVTKHILMQRHLLDQAEDRSNVAILSSSQKTTREKMEYLMTAFQQNF